MAVVLIEHLPVHIRAVIISTPTETHVEYVERAANAGKAIFCEKPVSLDLARATQAIALVKERNVPFQIGFDRRFDPGHVEVKRQIAAERLAKLINFSPSPAKAVERSGFGGLA